MDFLLRTIVYVCAFAGAGWFVLWIKTVLEQPGNSWPTSFTVVIVIAVVGGLLTAILRTKKPLG
jgi:hypothetical protein